MTYEYDAEGNRTAQIDVETGTRTEYTNNTNGDLTQVVMETATCNGKTSTTTYVYGNGLLSQNNSNGYLTFHYNNIGSTILLTNEEGEAEETYTYGPYGEILSGDTSKTPYLYNGMYGVSTDANGLYYMRARYYNVSIKRFINQDVVNGSITNSQSLNKFSYVQGNPISLTDPFGLSPNISISGIGHAALDLLGVIPGFDLCDAINTAWYLKEGDYENAALSAVACIPLLGSVVGNGLKWGAKGVANAEKVADTVKLGSRIVGDGGALLLSGGQAVESAKQVYTNITNGEGLTWKNAVDVLTLGISVAGMGMAGASIAKSGKSLKAMYKGETAVSNVATSNATKGVSAANSDVNKVDNRLVTNAYFNNGERVATNKQIRKYKKQMNSQGINVVVDRKGIKLTGNKAAGFDYSTGTVYIKKKAGVIDLYHEGYHAQQFLEVGKEKYISLGSLAREEYVYEQIMNNRKLFNDAELKGAQNYIERLRRKG